MAAIMLAADAAMPPHVIDQARDALAAILAAQPPLPEGMDTDDARQARNALLLTQWTAFAMNEVQPKNKAITSLVASLLAPMLAQYDVLTQARILQDVCNLAITTAAHIRGMEAGGGQ